MVINVVQAVCYYFVKYRSDSSFAQFKREDIFQSTFFDGFQATFSHHYGKLKSPLLSLKNKALKMTTNSLHWQSLLSSA